MADKLKPFEQRLAYLNDTLLAPKAQPVSFASGNDHGDPQKLLLGAMLRAAERSNKGMKLSALEERLISTLSTLTTAEDVPQYGTAFSKARSSGDLRSAGYSESVCQLDINQPYTDDVLQRDAQAMAETMLAQPNNKIIDVNDMDGGCIDTEESSDAMAAAGYGVTIFDAPKTPQADTFSSFAIGHASRCKLILQRFKCHRRNNDSAFGPRNEIYFATAAASDLGEKCTLKTDVYGEIDHGSERTFKQPSALFSGEFDKLVDGHIEIWEHDDGGSEWLAKMRSILAETAEWCVGKAVEAVNNDDNLDADSELSKAGAIMALAGICIGLFNALIGWIKNDDDQVAKQTFAWTKRGLKEFLKKPNKSFSMMFDGGKMGKHELWISVAELGQGSSRSVQCSTLSIKSGANNSWTTSTDSNIPEAGHQAGIAVVTDGAKRSIYPDSNGNLRIFTIGPSNARPTLMHTLDTATAQEGAYQTNSKPALTCGNGKLFAAWQNQIGNSGAYKVRFAWSTDHGSRWNWGVVGEDANMVNDDNCIRVSATSSPSLHYAHPKGEQPFLLLAVSNEAQEIVVLRSTNEGKTWSRMPNFAYKERVLSPAGFCTVDSKVLGFYPRSYGGIGGTTYDRDWKSSMTWSYLEDRIASKGVSVVVDTNQTVWLATYTGSAPFVLKFAAGDKRVQKLDIPGPVAVGVPTLCLDGDNLLCYYPTGDS